MLTIAIWIIATFIVCLAVTIAYFYGRYTGIRDTETDKELTKLEEKMGIK